MRHVLACILGVFSFGVVLAEKSEFAHWRWWFLAATSDSATITLYNDVEQKYLTISDLRALREDLEPHYRRLSDTITSTSDAQMAALLIRLFHYSTARPYKTAVYTERIADKLASYLSGRVDTSVTMYQIIDLWTACDLGMNAMLSPDGYEAFIAIQDHQKTIGILSARFQVGGSDSLSRYRCFVQSIDGVTKHLEFNGIRDSAYAAALVSALSSCLDSIDVNRWSHEGDGRWGLLGRFSQVLQARMYDNTNLSAQAELAIEMSSLATYLNPQHVTPCFPEVRLRTCMSSFLDRRPSSSQVWERIAFSFQEAPLYMRLMAESTHPGLSNFLVDSISIVKLFDDSPVLFGSFRSDSAKREYLRVTRGSSTSYHDCYRAIYPSTLREVDPSDNIPTCDKSELIDNIMMDRHRELRNILIHYFRGDTFEVHRQIDNVISRVSRRSTDLKSAGHVLSWALGFKRLSFTDDQDARIWAALLLVRIFECEEAIRQFSPVNTASLVTNARLSLAGSYVQLLRTKRGRTVPYVLGWVLGRMLAERSRITAKSRLYPLPSIDASQYGPRYPPQLAETLASDLRNVFEDSALAEYVSSQADIDLRYLTALNTLSDVVSQHQRVLRFIDTFSIGSSQGVHHLNEQEVKIVMDRCYASASGYEELYSPDRFDYLWSIQLVTNDTISSSLDIPSALIESSLKQRNTTLMYGLNISTQLDSILFKMLDDLRSSTGKTYKKLIFLPVDILYAYNPMISHFNGRYLVNEYEVSVSTCLRARASNAIDSIRLQIVKPGDSDLAYARSESEAICDLVRSRGGVASVLSKIENERDMSQQLESSTALHISSHASQANLISDIEEQPLLRELMRRDDIGSLARAMRGPLIQYKSETRTSGPLYGDGFISPLEMEVYNVKVPKLVFLSTCQTTTQTSDHWEPPDGMIRVSFSRGAECVVTSPIAVPDRYAASYAIEFYDQLSRTKLPHKAANEIVRQGIKEGKSVREYGIYFPIYFSEE